MIALLSQEEDTLGILVCDETFFDIDSVFSSENEFMWTMNHADTDEGEMVCCRKKGSSRESDGGAVGCSKGLTPLLILE